jgi:hypothetical protein
MADAGVDDAALADAATASATTFESAPESQIAPVGPCGKR